MDLELIGKRIEVKGYRGTIKYAGKLLHEVKNKRINKNDEWLGIEWDVAERGTHKGTVKNFTYFVCDPLKSASLIKKSKVDFGKSFIKAYVKKYFKN